MDMLFCSNPGGRRAPLGGAGDLPDGSRPLPSPPRHASGGERQAPRAAGGARNRRLGGREWRCGSEPPGASSPGLNCCVLAALRGNQKGT